jgi:hypothetical protein
MNTPALTRAVSVIAVSACLAASAVLAGCSSAGVGGASGPATPATGTPTSDRVTPASGLGSCSAYPGAKSCYFIAVTATGSQSFHGTETVPNQQACTGVLAADASANGGRCTAERSGVPDRPERWRVHRLP